MVWESVLPFFAFFFLSPNRYAGRKTETRRHCSPFLDQMLARPLSVLQATITDVWHSFQAPQFTWMAQSTGATLEASRIHAEDDTLLRESAIFRHILVRFVLVGF